MRQIQESTTVRYRNIKKLAVYFFSYSLLFLMWRYKQTKRKEPWGPSLVNTKWYFRRRLGKNGNRQGLLKSAMKQTEPIPGDLQNGHRRDSQELTAATSWSPACVGVDVGVASADTATSGQETQNEARTCQLLQWHLEIRVHMDNGKIN
jgi:hypothetical protein